MANTDSQGTHLYLTFDGTTVLQFPCPTGITGIGFTSEARNNICLDQVIGAPKVGRKTLSAFTVNFTVEEGDTAHEQLMAMIGSPVVEVPFAIMESQNDDPPTLTDGAFVAPAGRAGWIGSGAFSGLTMAYEGGQDYGGSFTYQPYEMTRVAAA